MSQIKHHYTRPEYKVSTDYVKLWDLIQSGIRVLAWIVYTDKYKEPIWDLVEVKNPFMEKDDYRIGVRGIEYTGSKGFMGFLSVCEMYSLHYVEPTSTTAASSELR